MALSATSCVELLAQSLYQTWIIYELCMDLSDYELIHYHLTEREIKSYVQPFYCYCHAAVHTVHMHGTH